MAEKLNDFSRDSRSRTCNQRIKNPLLGDITRCYNYARGSKLRALTYRAAPCVNSFPEHFRNTLPQ